jgi:hypothetical protein
MSGWKRRSNSLGASGSPSGKSATSYRFGNSSTSRSGAAFSSPLARLRGFSKRKRSPHAKTKPRPPTSLARQAQELLYRLDRERAQPRAQHWHGRNTLKLRSDNSSNSVTCEPARVIPVAAPARIAYAVLALTNFFEGNTVADVTPRICERYVEKRGRSVGTARRELGVLRALSGFSSSGLPGTSTILPALSISASPGSISVE